MSTVFSVSQQNCCSFSPFWCLCSSCFISVYWVADIFNYQINFFQCTVFLTKIVTALVHFDVYAAVALLVSTVYWVRDNAPLLLSAKQSRKVQIQIQVWSILMFIVYEAIALLGLLGCRHCPLVLLAKHNTIKAKNKWKLCSKCQKLRVEILYLV